MKSKSAWILGAILAIPSPALAQQAVSIGNSSLSVRVNPQNGSYEVTTAGALRPVLVSRVGAQIDHRWVSSSDYARHQAAETAFDDALGRGHALTITFSGAKDFPDLICVLRLYDDHAYGDVSVFVKNTTNRAVTVQAIRDVDATGEPRISLGGPENDDRILAGGFTEDPAIHIGSLSQAPKSEYFSVNDVLVYNTESKESLLLAALTADKFLTVSHLRVGKSADGDVSIASFTVDSTGTTEAVLPRDEISPDQRIQLSLTVPPGQRLDSERVIFAAGPNYHSQLEAYGQAVRRLHHARVSGEAPMGWWSWTVFYSGTTEGDALTNASWLAAHLKDLGFRYFHLDEGYQYARGEYTTADATRFPHGMRYIGQKLCQRGLTFGIWTAPFEVSERAWIYEHHKDWLVHDKDGKPIQIGYVDEHSEPLYVLDTTNPGAQASLRQTYRTLTRDWGVRYIKLDFMDSSAIEGYHYRPNTTALEALRIGLQVIRGAVGENVLLDKDGSPMLTPVGLVDEGRISVDTGHSFEASQDAAMNIAARYYMDRNFYVSDPDAFSVSEQLDPQQTWHESKKPLTLSDAQVAIVLAAVAGGMYEIGDDLPTLGSEPQRLALVENPELLHMVELGRAAVPLDLMTFTSEDQRPSVFFLREDRRQSMLAVFNWTETARSRQFTMAQLGLPSDGSYEAYDVLDQDRPIALENGELQLQNQSAHSVRLIKIIDTAIPAAAPSITAQVPSSAHAGDAVKLSATADAHGVPASLFHWDFGDGTSADGAEVSHTFTRASTYTVELTVEGVEGLAAHKNFSISVTGFPNTQFDFKTKRRYAGDQKR